MDGPRGVGSKLGRKQSFEELAIISSIDPVKNIDLGKKSLN